MSLGIETVRFNDFAMAQVEAFKPSAEAGEVLAATKTFAVLGIAASGKGTVAKHLVDTGFADVAISDTTRDIKDRDRINPSDPDSYPTAYHFVEMPVMVGKILAGEMVEVAAIHGKNIYGTSAAALEKVASSGKRPMLEIDVQGVKQLQTVYPEMPSFFLTLSTVPTWISRWAARDADINQEEFDDRVTLAKDECKTAIEMAYDDSLTLIANHNVEVAADSITAALQDGIVANQPVRLLRLREFVDVLTVEHESGRLWEDFQTQTSTKIS